MVVMPLTYGDQNRLANDINTILSKIRRGCAMARQDSQSNPATNMMVDLPEGIDFEINAILSYQANEFSRIISTSNTGTQSQGESQAGSEFDSETLIASGSSSESSSATQSSSNSQSNSDLDLSAGTRANAAGGGRQIASFEDETGATGAPIAMGALTVPAGATAC